VNADVPKLTGILAIRRGELRLAHAELQKAHARDATDCDTDVLLGDVLLELREWDAAEPPFMAALECFDAHDEELRKEIAHLRSAGRERSIARREQQIAANQQLRAQSFFNLAVAAFNRGDMAAARGYAEHVADDDRFGARVRELLARIRRPA
jgi:tetratricopeptide (TPR) repeat protein